MASIAKKDNLQANALKEVNELLKKVEQINGVNIEGLEGATLEIKYAGIKNGIRIPLPSSEAVSLVTSCLGDIKKIYKKTILSHCKNFDLQLDEDEANSLEPSK